MSSLSDYLVETRQLLRDESTSAPLYSTADLTAHINRAIRQRDLDLGINRMRISFPLTANVYEYPFATIVSGGTLLEGSAANLNPIDVTSIVVWPLGTPPQGTPYLVGRWPYSLLSYLITTSAPSWPVKYCVYGPSTIMFGPVPAYAYPCYWDFFGATTPLVNAGDTDPMPYPYTDPVAFAAAGFAKYSAQRADEARVFYNPDPRAPGLYQQRLAMVRGRSRPMQVRDPASGLPWRWR
jgi:hypothetical protein